ncbi:MAG: Bsp6I family type II restriction endonuclease [Mycoplasmataceae bacterium]|nr:Bsp6I family type II restriction endonuclease [Mycoplasmataceae bacterium]
MKNVQLTLKNGQNIIGREFDEKDYKGMISFLNDIKINNLFLNNLGGRKINVPDVISEGIFCYHYNAIRTNGTAKSYDCVDIITKDGIQVKSASIEKDCTSFGPKSTWDKLYFIDFSNFINCKTNTIDFYLIDIDLSSIVLNEKKHETFKQQQKQNRRPRLSLKKLIKKHNIKIDKTIIVI